MLFTGEACYPFGGMGDFHDTYDTKKEAEKEGKKYDWHDVVDIDEMIIAKRKK